MLDKIAAPAPTRFVSFFDVEFRPSEENSRDLIVSISSSRGFGFYRSPFDASTLFIADKLNLYYMKGFDSLYLSIKALIEHHNYDRILFLGISKGGWAAFAMSYLFASRDSSRTYYCLAFSPQTQIWPKNDNVTHGSYLRLVKERNTDIALKSGLRSRGSVPDLNLSNLMVHIYYGAFNKSDAIEALRPKGSSVARFPLPTAGHLSHLPFVFDASDRAAATKLVDIATRQGQAVGDGMPEEEKEQFVDELVKIGKQPSVAELARAMLNWTKPLNLVVCVILCDDFVAAAMAVAVV